MMRARAVLILLVAMTILVNNGICSHSLVRCIQSERQALLTFKQSLLDDEDNHTLSSWTSNSSRSDCCLWEGIVCDKKTNHVVSLQLVAKWYRNEISSSLLQLKYLESLALVNNNFSKIPEFIGSLTRLTYLDLSGNTMNAIIPSQLGNLTSLRYLTLGGTIDPNISTIVDDFRWISHLSSLQELSLIAVNFTADSAWFQSIKTHPSLASVYLQGCQLPEVDSSSSSHINSSNTLKSVHVELSTIHPKSFPWLVNISRNLVDLTLNDNQIGALLPNSFANMYSLVHIEMRYNEFFGEIPKSLGNICCLKSLDLSYNKLNGTLDNLLDSLISCTNQNQLGGPIILALEELILGGNRFEGPFPSSLRQFQNLKILDLQDNLFTGPLPNLLPFSSLSEFRASNNKFDGTIPESISQLSNLSRFSVSSNCFTGVVSEAHLMNLSKLIHLDLSFNSLTLTLSSNWVPPFQLYTLYLASCIVGPRFPNWLRMQSQLLELDISNSNIYGVIPLWFSNYVSSTLGYLNLSFNYLSGMEQNSSLRAQPLIFNVLDLSYNRFHGAIPTSFSIAREIYLSNNMFTRFKHFICENYLPGVILDLSDNLLFGRMPDCWVCWSELVILNLENNNLFGSIPSSLGLLTNLQTLRLRNNSLSGNLPSSLNGIAKLVLLDVGHNYLNGSIPTWIGESHLVYNLKVLSLKSNEFSGKIPSNLCHLNSIQILDLSLNNLSGVIPSCINNFTSMAHFTDDADETITITYPYGTTERRYENDALMMWKGLEYKYDKILGLLRVIDLSSNSLSGKIPAMLANLVGLFQVNLSKNHLSGSIPNNIGQLSRLESLDLSHNQLSGKIPTELAKLFFLNYLDLSSNHLHGKIPTSTQLQSFSGSRYAGNTGLCGPPLTSTCPGDKTLPSLVPSNELSGEKGSEWSNRSWFNIGIGVGFAVGFWGVCGTLVVKRSWRHAYFRLLNKWGEWLYVTIMVGKAKMRAWLRK